MLPRSARLRSSKQFAQTVRRGVRVGTPAVVVHAYRRPTQQTSPQVGFVVSKAVGGAVVRNRVKRRLREMVRIRFRELVPGDMIVVRALPAASAESGRLAGDFDAAWNRALAKANRFTTAQDRG